MIILWILYIIPAIITTGTALWFTYIDFRSNICIDVHAVIAYCLIGLLPGINIMQTIGLIWYAIEEKNG